MSRDDLLVIHGCFHNGNSRELRSQLKKEIECLPVIAFANGCFDLFHPGHAELIRFASQLQLPIVVAINSDLRVAQLKGSNRPFFNIRDRASILCMLRGVHSVIEFGEETPLQLLEELMPKQVMLIKGQEYQGTEVPGQKLIEAYGGKMLFCPELSHWHSSDIVQKLSRQAPWSPDG